MRIRTDRSRRVAIVIPVTASTPMWQLGECLAAIVDAMTPASRLRADMAFSVPEISAEIVLSVGPGDQLPPVHTAIPDGPLPPGLTLVLVNGAGGSFAENTNRGIMRALEDRCEWVLLLNADTHIAPGQLEQWEVALSVIDDVAICGCVSNYIGGPQLVPFPQDDILTVATTDALAAKSWDVPTRAGQTLHEVTLRTAREMRTKDARLQDAPDIKMVAAAIPRWAFDLVGFLDTRFRPGNREDVDWCWRARQAGLRTVFSHGLFVHHYGSSSFKDKAAWQASMDRNRVRFNAKWSHTTRYQMSLRGHDYVVRPEALLDVMGREEPYSLDPLLWRARAYSSLRPRAALRDLTGYMGAYPDDPEAHWLMVEVMVQLGRRDDAADVVADMRAKFPLMRSQIEETLEPLLGKD